jgi:hypothetical protein
VDCVADHRHEPGGTDHESQHQKNPHPAIVPDFGRFRKDRA